MDQYKHPCESKHSYDEVLGWFESNGFDFLFSIPKIGPAAFGENEKLFAAARQRNAHLAASHRTGHAGARRSRRRAIHHDRPQTLVGRTPWSAADAHVGALTPH